MELTGAIYLSTMAIVGITFATMTAIVLVLRHTTGQPVSTFQMFLTRLYVETGILVALFSVLPMMLADFGLPHHLVWRLCSGALAALLLHRVVSIPLRRKAATNASTPPRAYVSASLRALLAVLLVLNVVGVPFAPGPGPYELSLILKIANQALHLTVNLKTFLQGSD
jgi:hypothetical protein